MSAAFVPTFTRHADDRRQGRQPGGSATTSSTRCSSRPARSSCSGWSLRAPMIRLLTAADYALVPGKLELTVIACADHAAAPHADRRRRGADGDAQLAAPLLHSRAVARDVQHRDDPVRHLPSCHLPRSGLAPITLIAISTLAGASHSSRFRLPPLRREGFRWRAALELAGRRAAARAHADGAWHHRPRRDADERRRQSAARDERGRARRRGSTTRSGSCICRSACSASRSGPPSLPAVSRHRRASRHSRCARHDGRRTVADDDVERAGDRRPDRAGLPIVRLLFERRAFTASDTAATAAALQLYALGLLGYSIVRITSPTFYALGRNRTPVAGQRRDGRWSTRS